MRGTVLLLDEGRSRRLADVRRHELIVYEAAELVEAIERLDSTDPDVIVAVLTRSDTRSIVPALRSAADRATSIIVAADAAERDAAREAGADAFLPSSTAAADLLYEVHRALILRRSGRRLPWNW